ncbi:MAG: hypothetical protein H5T69_06790 [Chloroflexi bacterium]|nr:hypothetical protein [Chloroflexota bacterium]
MEERARSGVRWRGCIVHVPSGRRHYFGRLGDMELIMGPYLETKGIKPWGLGLKSWLHRRHLGLQRLWRQIRRVSLEALPGDPSALLEKGTDVDERA